MRRMYSENQIKELVENNPQAVVNALKNQDVVANTLKQTSPNEAVSIESAEVSLPEGIDFSITYGKFEELNNVAYLVLIFNFINTTEASVSIGNNNSITFSIPEGIASKIVDKNGIALSESGASLIGISADYAFSDSSLSQFLTGRVVNISRNTTGTKNKITLQVRDAGAVGASKTQQYVFRTFFTLI